VTVGTRPKDPSQFNAPRNLDRGSRSALIGWFILSVLIAFAVPLGWSARGVPSGHTQLCLAAIASSNQQASPRQAKTHNDRRGTTYPDIDLGQ
jgi:hypothetical protein